MIIYSDRSLSFAVDIQELKSIADRANHDSVVLGDELC